MNGPGDELTDEQRRILTDIQADGLHVATTAESEDAPGYSLSLGLTHSFDHPEVIVFGLAPEVATDLINVVADEASGGRKFLPGSEVNDLLQSYPVRFTAVDGEHREQFFGTATWLYAERELAVVQLVYPDQQGRWPWDASSRDGFRANQPLLSADSAAGFE